MFRRWYNNLADLLDFLPSNSKVLCFTVDTPPPEIPVTHDWTMSDSSEKPWSDNPYAPQIPSWLYLTERDIFDGILVGAIFYGILTNTSV